MEDGGKPVPELLGVRRRLFQRRRKKPASQAPPVSPGPGGGGKAPARRLAPFAGTFFHSRQRPQHVPHKCVLVCHELGKRALKPSFGVVRTHTL